MIDFLFKPEVLLFTTVLCFIIALGLVEAMKFAEKKGCRWSALFCALLSIAIGIAGWVGFFIEIFRFIHTGFNP